jgi:hypothetical protein
MPSSSQHEPEPIASRLADSSSPVDIPIEARQDSTAPDHGCALDADLHQLVGSPENLSHLSSQPIPEYFTPETPGTIQSPGYSHGPSFPGPSRPRPSYHRSSTTPALPIAHRRRQSSLSAAADAASSFLHFTQRDRQPKESRDWTVFGDLMGQTRDGRPETSFRSPLPRPAARESVRDVLSPNSSTMQRSMLRSLPSPGYDLHGPIVSEPEDRDTLDTLEGSSTTSGCSSDDNESIHPSLPSPSGSPTTSESMTDKKGLNWPRVPTLTPVQKNILKCSVAYFLGSLFTFSPYLSGIISDVRANGPGTRTPSGSAHMVATV